MIVVVLTGKSKGQKGTITQAMPTQNKVIVSGVNVAIRHQRQTQNSQGGRIPTELPLDRDGDGLLDAWECLGIDGDNDAQDLRRDGGGADHHRAHRDLLAGGPQGPRDHLFRPLRPRPLAAQNRP